MYNCTIKYHGEDAVEKSVTFAINSYNVMKDGANILPEFHIHYNKDIDVPDYNTIEDIALWSENYVVDSVQVVNAVGTVVQGSEHWKKIIGYSCSSGSNALLPDCLLRLQG